MHYARTRRRERYAGRPVFQLGLDEHEEHEEERDTNDLAPPDASARRIFQLACIKTIVEALGQL